MKRHRRIQTETHSYPWIKVIYFARRKRRTMVRKIPNSGSMSTTSPSVKMNWFLRSFLHVSTTWICWAATDSTGSSIRLNSSKQPQLPDCASPATARRREEGEEKKETVTIQMRSRRDGKKKQRYGLSSNDEHRQADVRSNKTTKRLPYE